MFHCMKNDQSLQWLLDNSVGHVQTLRESSINVISGFTICVNRKICEWRFSLFLEIMIEKLANY